MRINVNKQNSRVIGGKLFITMLKAHKVKDILRKNINYGTSITHPSLGQMVEYTGTFSRKEDTSIRSIK